MIGEADIIDDDDVISVELRLRPSDLKKLREGK